jgi:hypothetical protein
MTREELLAILKQGVVAWNNWRRSNPDIKPDLSGVDLIAVDLTGADLSEAKLIETNLTEANLSKANFTAADLSGANITGATLNEANVTGANMSSVEWNRRKMLGKYRGIRGLDSCYGNALFKREAADQDFLDSLEVHWHGTWRIVLFRLWGWSTDYGRSLPRIMFFAFVVAMLYGLIYDLQPEMLNYGCGSTIRTWFTPFYFSIVTYTTLGFGDVFPTTVAGEIIISTEVILGYLTLGLLLSVLAEKLARRS